ncbi:MAG TPA: DHA2 family efflux MFS transporter permease subunit [Candidatus Binataceae bacterium]|nr:DHA2 family efflux MFS transporter permease subunit [Candidatus Binataceae bacterium]
MEAAEAATTDEPKRQTGSHKWLVAIAVMVGCAMEVIDSSIVNVSLPHMQGSFSASLDEIAWVLTSYIVANSIMIPMTGWISARVGRKRYFLTSVCTFVIASALCGAAGTLSEIVTFRLLQGLSGAAMIPSSQAILMETFPPEEQQMAMATWGVGMLFMPILGPTLGGWITDNWNWRWNFYINLPLGTLAFLMVSTFVHDPHYLQRHERGRVDYLGVILLVLWLGLMQIVADRGQRSDWFAAPWVVWSSIICGLAMIVLIVRELRFKAPILDLRILKKPLFSIAVCLTIIHSFLLFGTGLLTPIFLQEFMGYSAWKAGLVMFPRSVGAIVSMVFVGQVSRAGYDNKRLIGVSFTIVGLGLWLMSRWNLQVSMWEMIWTNVVMGLGFGMSFPILSAAALSTVERERMGYATSLFNMLQQQGRAIGIAYMTNVLVRNQQIHQARLVEHFSIFDAWRLSKLGPHLPGSPVFQYLPQVILGQKQGLGMLYGVVQSQAAMMAFNDIYRLLAIVTVLMIPSFLILRGPITGAAAPAH